MICCSKDNINFIIKYIVNKLNYWFSSNDSLTGFYVFLIHFVCQIIFTIIFLFYPLSTLYYFIVVIWIFVLISKIYFRGCLITKIERHLWKTKTWYGPLFEFGKLNQLPCNTMINISVCLSIIICMIIFARILFQI